jgi:uncharacterized protein
MSLFRLSASRFPIAPFRCIRSFSTGHRLLSDGPQPVVLPRLKSDLKAAMRAKDKTRLQVLRWLLAEITNRSKTDKPIEDDAVLYTTLEKRIFASKKAIEQFEDAKRSDLVEKEQAEVQVLEEYCEEIPKVTSEELNSIIKAAVESFADGQRKFGPVMKEIVSKTAGRPVDTPEIVRKLKGLGL